MKYISMSLKLTQKGSLRCEVGQMETIKTHVSFGLQEHPVGLTVDVWLEGEVQSSGEEGGATCIHTHVRESTQTVNPRD